MAGRSSLTKLLKPSFTGKESQTLVLATVSPAAKDTEHTVNTMRHACVMDGRPTEDGKAWISGDDALAPIRVRVPPPPLLLAAG